MLKIIQPDIITHCIACSFKLTHFEIEQENCLCFDCEAQALEPITRWFENFSNETYENI